MRLAIGLLGRPTIDLDGERRTLAGNKTWALLARIAVGSATTRRGSAAMLWPEADDPLAACRWTILQVRRAIEPAATLADLDGEVRLTSLDGADVDVDVLVLHAGLTPIDGLEDVGGVLLEGVDLRDAPEFEDWLVRERTRASSALGATLRWAAAVTATTDLARGIGFARRAIELDPYDDAAHEALVRLLAAAGDRTEAKDHVRRYERRYRDDLGIDLPEVIRRGLDRQRPVGAPAPGAAAAEALLEVARSRAAGGDYAGAIDASRRAEAAAAGLPALEAQALLQLGGILVHSVRGRDREAVGLLDRALELAVAAGDEVVAAEAEREIAWVQFLGASYGAAEGILHRSITRSEAVGDAVGAARALVVLGACLSDRADYDHAGATLEDAIDRLRALGDRWEAFALSFLARVRLLTGLYAEAKALGDRAVARCQETGWLSLVPWPMVVATEAAMRIAPGPEHDAMFDRAYALSCEIGDPCWEAFSLRGKGLVAHAQGRDDDAERLFKAGLDRARSLPDIYAWAPASLLTDLVELQRGRDAMDLAAALAVTRRGPMPALLERILAASEATG